VPPYLRLFLHRPAGMPRKMMRACLRDPIPVSVTWNATTERAFPRTGWSGLQPLPATDTDNCNPALLVNLNAFESRFLDLLQTF